MTDKPRNPENIVWPTSSSFTMDPMRSGPGRLIGFGIAAVALVGYHMDWLSGGNSLDQARVTFAGASAVSTSTAANIMLADPNGSTVIQDAVLDEERVVPTYRTIREVAAWYPKSKVEKT